ncbi:MAG: PQQ-binding-like beta-propeller repeat protein [Blastocatellia bacterium]
MKKQKCFGIAGLLLSLLAYLTLARAQSPKPAEGLPAAWLMDGGDVERTGWQKNEHILSTTSVKNMKLLWKTKLDNEPRQMHNLLPVLIASNVTTASGPKQIVLATGVTDNLYGLDAETGAILWKLHFQSEWTPPATGGRGGGILCPGGITATPIIAPTETPGKYIVYAAAWDGTLRRVDLATGKEIAPPSKFMPPNGKPYALNMYKNAIYVHTAQGCGGNPNMVYIYDLATDKVGWWGPAGGK